MTGTYLTTRQLQYIVAVADTGSFSAAARACFVAQPSLSAQVAQAERTLGAKLFERGARRVRCTAAGEQAVQKAREALRAIEGVANVVKWRGVLRIGAIDTVAPYLFAPWLKDVRAQIDRPVIPVQGRTQALLAQLREGQIDAAVLALPVDRGLATCEIGDDSLLLLTPSAEGASSVTVKDLAGREMLLLEEGHCLREQATDVCRLGGSELNGVLHATSLETLIEMVAAGFGSTLVPAIAAEKVTARTDVTLRSFTKEGPVRKLVLAYEPGHTDAEVFAKLAELARQFVV
jgi:LysR family hydrogen peroxide-inducible transcriptional activator